MKFKAYLLDVLPKTPFYHLARKGLMNPPRPITLTFSVTAACQSKCKTCNIGLRYLSDPSVAKSDLTLMEIERIFATLGEIYFLNISGGEPFLRKDLPQIIELACRYLRPKLIHIPTNAIQPRKIIRLTTEIMEVVKKYDAHTPVTIKPSIDGVGNRHDEIRGMKGNFESLTRTIDGLKKVAEQFSNLHVELGTVVSNFNIDHLAEIEDYVHRLGVQSYRNEIAEQRSEFFNKGDPITPDAATYERLMRDFASKIEHNIGDKRILTRVFEAIRVEYYSVAVRILRQERQVIPCFGGISNVHLNSDGELWPCCVLGYDRPLGNLREVDLDFFKVYHGAQAQTVRRFIADGGCACPLANQVLSNILFYPRSLIHAGLRALRFMAK